MKTAIKHLLLLSLFSGVSAYMVFLNIGTWLSIKDPPQQSDIVICLGGGVSDDRIKKAIQLLENGFAGSIMATTNGAYQQILQKNIPPEKILKANRPVESTYHEGLSIQQVLLEGHYTSALVVSDPYHLYRVKWTMTHTLGTGSPHFSFISSEAPSLDGFWWQNEKGRIFVLSEIPKIVYYWIWHGILGIEDDPAWATGMEQQYVAVLTAIFRFMKT
jgi:uncharacterized SAM-binding protein YcdF (DUF218 family)